MQTMKEPMETLHVFVVPEDKLPPKPDYLGIAIATVCSLVLAAIVGLILAIGSETKTARLTIKSFCTAISYAPTLVRRLMVF